MLTFTVGGKGRRVYTKLRLCNEIKSYVTYLIANSKAEMHFFTNIELGHSFKNPHIHTQVWSADKGAVRAIYDKVIKKFLLVKKRCAFSEPQQLYDFYDYVVKDYSSDLSDNYLWNLEQTKKRMRKTLGLKLRFYSKSKSKYSQKLYKIVYRSYGVLRGKADKWLDFILPLFFNKKAFILKSISSFKSIKNKEINHFLDVGEMVGRFADVGKMILFYSPSNSPPLFLFS